MKVVVNTGPLVFLSKINRLSILQKFGHIVAPKGVISEIEVKQDAALAAVVRASSDWLKVKTVRTRLCLRCLQKNSMALRLK